MKRRTFLHHVGHKLHRLSAFIGGKGRLRLSICILRQHGNAVALDQRLLRPEIRRLLHIEAILSGLLLDCLRKLRDFLPGCRPILADPCLLQQVFVDVENRVAQRIRNADLIALAVDREVQDIWKEIVGKEGGIFRIKLVDGVLRGRV